MKRFISFTLIVLFICESIKAQNVGIGTSLPDASAALEIKNTQKGLLISRMTSVQRKTITSPATGLLVFDTDKNSLYIFTGAQWMPISFNSEKEIAPVNYTASDSAAGDNFGSAVAIDGDYAIVGANADDINGNESQGSAYIFYRSASGWVQQIKLVAPDGEANDRFGANVAIYGDYAIVGAPFKTINGADDQGAVYVFVRNGTNWTQQAKLTATDGAAFDYFGKVAIDGSRIVVGATGDNIGANDDQGSVYVFIRIGTNWTQSTKLISSDGAALDQFGSAVDIESNYIVVGAACKTISGVAKAGSAYIFQNTAGIWSEQQKLPNNGPEYEDYFGFAVAINNDKVVIGAPGKDNNGVESVGRIAIYIRNVNTWFPNQYVTPFDSKANDRFGTSVDIINGIIISGSPSHLQNGTLNQGKVYLYEQPSPISSWLFLREVINADPSFNSYFGNSCSLDKLTRRFIIGGYGKDQNTGEVSFGVID